MPVVLGPYPLCPACRRTNGGLVAVRHRQVHLRAHGKEACVDRGLSGLLTSLWAVSDTRSCCEDDHGRAYVVPTPETRGAASELLIRLGLHPADVDGILYFAVADSFRLDDAGWVAERLTLPTGSQVSWRVGDGGAFERGTEPDVE